MVNGKQDDFIPFHSVTETYYTSAFFRKEKKRCCSVMTRKICLTQAFARISSFILNTQYKIQLVELIFNCVRSNTQLVLQEVIQTKEVVLACGNEFWLVYSDHSRAKMDLRSNQEEAVTKIIVHSLDVLSNADILVYLRSIPRDTDVLVSVLCLTKKYRGRLFMIIVMETTKTFLG